MTNGTGRRPIDAMKIVIDNPYIGTQSLSGKTSLYARCIAKTNNPIPVPIDEVVKIIFRPNRSIRNTVIEFATS